MAPARRWLLIPLLLLVATPAAAWNLVLPDTAHVDGDVARLGDTVTGPVPAAAAEIVVHAGGRPGTCVTVSRQGVLRRLVEAGLAAGVRLSGSPDCVLVFRGTPLTTDRLHEELRAVIQPLVPAPAAGAPAPWFELQVPSQLPTAADDWSLVCRRGEALDPGRNLVRCELHDGGRRDSFTVTVVLHVFGEVATARRSIRRETPLTEDGFTWAWRDLAEVAGDPVVGRESLAGSSCGRSLAAGDLLRERDLTPTPVIRAGDAVELRVVRGTVAVTVRAFARQAGCVGQTIPVRNELTGRLVNARVAAPGLVEWRK